MAKIRITPSSCRAVIYEEIIFFPERQNHVQGNYDLLNRERNRKQFLKKSE